MHPKLLTIAIIAGGLAAGGRADVATEPGTGPVVPLTSAAQVLNLSAEQAARSLPVRLRGVVIGEAPPVGKAFVLFDGSDSVYVRDATARDLGTFQRGDQVEVEATSDAGGFTPSLRMHSGRKLGEGAIPAPRAVTVDDLLAGRCDAQWVRVRGIIRQCEASTVWAGRWRLALATDGQLFAVHVNGDLSPERLVDAEVSVDCLVFNQHNMNRQAVSALLFVPDGAPITITVPAPEDPFATPVRAVSTLLQFEPKGRYGHRVHVRGRVIHDEPGVAFWIRDGDRGLGVISPRTEGLEPGDLVDVVGFPTQGTYTPRLEDAAIRKDAAGPPPPPVVPADLRAAIAHESDLVAIEARLVEQRPFAGGVALALNWRGGLVVATLALPGGSSVPADWRPGSLVRATGICGVPAVEPAWVGGTWEAHSFELKLRTGGDVSVIESPPWWNRQRVLWGLGLGAGGLLLALAGVLLAARRRLRQQAARRTQAEAEFSAILSERNRLAREIHDTLSQGLAAISVQLELAKNVGLGDHGEFGRHLETAHQLTRQTLAEARTSIWNMRSQVLEVRGLTGALQAILQQQTEGTTVVATFRVVGERVPLAPVVESELLRIGQEAVANALQHAAPRHIELTLTFGQRRLELVVADDGVGFEPARAIGPAGHFGLVGMRERTAQVGGSLEIESTPNRGTRLVVRVPLTPE